MAVTPKVLADAVLPGVLTPVTLYTAPTNGLGTRITAFSAYNTTATNYNYNVYIVPSGGSATTTNRIVPQNTVLGNGYDVPISVIGQMVPAGGTLQVEVDTIDTIAFRASGLELT